MKLFTKLANAFSAFNNGLVQPVVQQNTVVAQDLGAVPAVSFRSKVGSDDLPGYITTEDLELMTSNGFRKSILFRAVGSSLAMAFSAYRNTMSRKTQALTDRTWKPALQQAVAMIACAETYGQAVEMDLDTLNWLALGNVPAKMSPKNAAAIAEIKGETVQQVLDRNETKRKARYGDNLKLLEAFISEVTSSFIPNHPDWDGDHGVARIAMKHVLSAAGNQLEFVAGWSDDTAAAAEILLIRDDHAKLERIGRRNAEREERAGEGSREIDNQLLSADGMAQGMSSGK